MLIFLGHLEEVRLLFCKLLLSSAWSMAEADAHGLDEVPPGSDRELSLNASALS